MADFLATLAARSLGQLPSVMPRRSSRFEGDSAQAMVDGLDAIDVVEAPPRGPEASRRRDVAGERPARAEPAEPASVPEDAAPAIERGAHSLEVDVVGRHDSGREADARGTVQRAIERPPGPDTGAPGLDAGPDGAFVLETREVAELPHRQPAGGRGRRRDGAGRAWPMAGEAVSPEGESREVARGSPGEPAHEMTRQARGEAAPEPRDPLRVPTVVTSPGRDELAPRRDRPAPAPTVTVTIGRIEVRVPPAPQPSPPVPPTSHRQPPRISLDEYLRGERGRR